MVRSPFRFPSPSAPHNFARSQLTLNRATAEVVKWEPYSENSTGRKLRSWFRGLHTGEAFGFFGQTIAGLASLGGCFLVWTGLAMAWRRFRSWGRELEEPSVIQPALSKDAASIEISQDLQLEGEKSSMELEILPGESSQLGHATDRNGTAAHRHEAMRNYSGSQFGVDPLWHRDRQRRITRATHRRGYRSAGFQCARERHGPLHRRCTVPGKVRRFHHQHLWQW